MAVCNVWTIDLVGIRCRSTSQTILAVWIATSSIRKRRQRLPVELAVSLGALLVSIKLIIISLDYNPSSRITFGEFEFAFWGASIKAEKFFNLLTKLDQACFACRPERKTKAC